MTVTAKTIAEENAMEQFGQELAERLNAGDIVAIDGPLGAGKTVLCRGILRGLGYAGEVASPSYALIHEYHPPDTRVPVLHADLYRIENTEEIAELGLLEDGDGQILLVEWAQRLPQLAQMASCKISITRAGEGLRTLEIS